MDAQEFTDIAEKHSGFVYNVAYRMMGNPHDAEEVAQDAFVSTYKARDRFRGDAPANDMALPHHRQRCPHANSQGQTRQRNDCLRRRPN